MTQPSAEELARRRFVEFTADTINNTSSTDYPGVYPGEDHSWNLDSFRKSLQIEFHENSELNAVFSLVGINAAIANAFRRILIAEVPTIAIESVYFNDNTSVVCDEIVAQRLGLIPLKVDRRAFDWLRWVKDDSQPMDYNTMLLGLQVKCEFTEDFETLFRNGERDPQKLYKDAHVYARDLKPIPVNRQAKIFKRFKPLHPVNPDILIVKLRPGQAIDLKAHCRKGIGADHAKYSPVATASYRLMPKIDIIEPIIGADAKKFVQCFPKGVMTKNQITASMAVAGSPYEGHEGEDYAVVGDAIKDTVTRECLRHPEFKNKVKLGRVQDHFIFTIESTGQYRSDELFVEAVKLLKLKCARARKALHDIDQ